MFAMKAPELLHNLEIKLYAFSRVVCGREWNYPCVNSPFARMIYTLSGKAFVRHRGRRYTLAPGTITLTPPFIPVDYSCPDRFESYYAIFTCKTHSGLDFFGFGQMTYEMPEDELTLALFRRLHAANPHMALRQVDPAAPDYNDFIWKSDPDRQLPPEDLMATDGCLRLLLSRFINSFRLTTEDGTPEVRFLHLIHYIGEHLHEPLSLLTLAKEAGLQPTYFSDAFKKEIGQRPIAYLTSKRMERAQLLLQSTRQTIKEIAGNCGFPDPNYFCRVFQAELGMTPSDYRSEAELGQDRHS